MSTTSLAARLADLARQLGLDESEVGNLLAELEEAVDPSRIVHEPSTVELPVRLPEDGLTWQPLAPSAAPRTAQEAGGAPELTERYEDLGLIGAGAVGEVRRVLDADLNRAIAMKILRAEHAAHPSAQRRFIAEAQATSQLEHPGIIPVYDVGALPDGRAYFTMKEIRGRTLNRVVDEVHSSWVHAQAGQTVPPGAWTLRRLVGAFRVVCEAMAYAHSRGVVHRDLKPANIMVGDWGEVRILDWGLARVLQVAASLPEEDTVPVRISPDEETTRAGAVVGTPAYMAPEQARGEALALRPTADVYSLGAILYEILCGRRPYHEHRGRTVIEAVRRGPPQAPQGGMRVPSTLVRICKRAMARDAEDRHPDASGLVEELTAWLDGDRRRQVARQLVAEAAALEPEIVALRSRVRELRREARDLLAQVKPWAAVERKRPGWALVDAAEAAERVAERRELEHVQLLQSALTHDPDHPGAHDRLADLWKVRHAAAEEADDTATAARHELHLRAHDTGRHAAYLDGRGLLSLHTEPAGARATLHRFVERDRHLVPEPIQELGSTPLVAVPLARGAYLITLELPGHHAVSYPVRVDRSHHWDGKPPGGSEGQAVRMVPLGSLDEDDCYVPGGWFRIGGDIQAPSGRPQAWRWQDPFIIKRHPVTNRQYIAFLDDLVAQGHEDLALLVAPQHPPGTEGEPGAQIYGRDPSGSFHLRPDADGDVWEADWPVVMVDRAGALAYGAWLSRRDGRSWRLPTRDEWEKAGRGVDGRPFPWGHHLDPTFCCMRDSHEGRPLLAPVTAFPIDESPYGVRGMAGNAIDWCVDLLPAGTGDEAGEVGLICGGSWYSIPALIRLANALRTDPNHRSYFLGFRPARSL